MQHKITKYAINEDNIVYLIAIFEDIGTNIKSTKNVVISFNKIIVRFVHITVRKKSSGL